MKRISDKKMLPKWFCQETYRPLKDLSSNQLLDQFSRRVNIFNWLNYLETSQSRNFRDVYTGNVSDKKSAPLTKINLKDHFKGLDEDELELLAECNISFNIDHILRLILPDTGPFRCPTSLNFSTKTPAIYGITPLELERKLVSWSGEGTIEPQDHLFSLQNYFNSQLLLINLDGYSNEELITQFEIAISIAKKEKKIKDNKLTKTTNCNILLEQHLIALADLKIWEKVNNIKFQENIVTERMFYDSNKDFTTIKTNYKKLINLFNETKLTATK